VTARDYNDLTAEERDELRRLVPPLYPDHITPRQAINRYLAWLEEGHAEVARFLAEQPAQPRGR
jgi:hypothetical protein